MCLWRKREEIANASCTTVLLYHFQVDPEPARHQVWDPFDPAVRQGEVQEHSAEAGGGTAFNAENNIFSAVQRLNVFAKHMSAHALTEI